jgi:hypothetical protein
MLDALQFNDVAGCDYLLNVMICGEPMSHALFGVGGNRVLASARTGREACPTAALLPIGCRGD